ncbi:MAG TPA: LysE family translocator [Propionicimonas sp.]|nr:LysE family translocator [Propionicimonas sp.]HQA76774.1 LysE family translocator [Propionicimonas sp.]HQD96544.1 LysE family translocator [Propionicimonas sp.]
MTLTQAVLGFTLLAAVVTVTPGLDTVLVLRQALRGRRAVAFAAGLGICVGCLVWGVAAATGLAALFVASQTAYLVLKWAGIAFLLYLAYSYLRAAIRGDSHFDTSGGGTDTVREAFMKGLLTNLLNPKIAVFYVTVLPLFLPAGYPPAAIGALLAGIHAVLGMVWFTVVILGANALRGFLTAGRGPRIIDAAAGTAMLGFSVVLGLEH